MPVSLFVQSPSLVWLFVTQSTASRQAFLSLTVFWSLPKFMAIALMMPSSHLILCCPLLLLPSIFSSIRVFSSESALHIMWPKNWGFTFSIVFPMNIQGWFPLRLTGLIWFAIQETLKSLLPTSQFESINSLALSLLYGPTLTTVCEYWKDHQISSVAQLCLTFCDPHGLQYARLPCPSPTPRACSNSCPSSQGAIQPSQPLLSSSLPVFHLSQHQGLFQWVSSLHQVTKVLEFQLQHQSFQWTPRTDFL